MNYQSEYMVRYVPSIVENTQELVKYYTDFITDFCNKCNNPFTYRKPNPTCSPIRYMFKDGKNSVTTNMIITTTFEVEHKIITHGYMTSYEEMEQLMSMTKEQIVESIELRFIWQYKPKKTELDQIKVLCDAMRPNRISHTTRINSGHRDTHH